MPVFKHPIIRQWQHLDPLPKPGLIQPRCWKAEHTVVPIKPRRAMEPRAPRLRLLGSGKEGREALPGWLQAGTAVHVHEPCQGIGCASDHLV